MDVFATALTTEVLMQKSISVNVHVKRVNKYVRCGSRVARVISVELLLWITGNSIFTLAK